MNSLEWSVKLEDLTWSEDIHHTEQKGNKYIGRDKETISTSAIGGDQDAPGLKGTNGARKSKITLKPKEAIACPPGLHKAGLKSRILG